MCWWTVLASVPRPGQTGLVVSRYQTSTPNTLSRICYIKAVVHQNTKTVSLDFIIRSLNHLDFIELSTTKHQTNHFIWIHRNSLFSQHFSTIKNVSVYKCKEKHKQNVGCYVKHNRLEALLSVSATAAIIPIAYICVLTHHTKLTNCTPLGKKCPKPSSVSDYPRSSETKTDLIESGKTRCFVNLTIFFIILPRPKGLKSAVLIVGGFIFPVLFSLRVSLRTSFDYFWNPNAV